MRGEAAQARNDLEKVGVLALSVGGTMTSADQSILYDALQSGLRRGQFQTKPISYSTGSQCDATCLRGIGRRENVDFLLVSSVTISDRDYAVHVQLVDAKSGNTLAESSESCEICGISEAKTLIASSAATLRTKLDAVETKPAHLRLESQPSGALVFVDGRKLGVTPFDGTLVAGKHEIEVRLVGHEDVAREMQLVAGVSETVVLNLREIKRHRTPGPALQWSAITLGSALAIGGTILLVLDHREIRSKCDPNAGTQDQDGDCRYLWDTKLAGITMSLAGAALVGIGATWRVLDRRSSRESAKVDAGLSYIPGQALGVRLRGSF
jgi:hypothetical protein